MPDSKRAEGVAAWMKFYRPALHQAVSDTPEAFAFSISSVDRVADRMQAAFLRGDYSHDGLVIRRACKHFGIKTTRAAIEAFFNSGGQACAG